MSEGEKRPPLPILTALVCAACVLVWIGIMIQSGQMTREVLAREGLVGRLAPEPMYIWGGAYWGLITSVFVHLEIWHLLFNMYWLWILGSILEQEIGSLRWLVFFLCAALVSSALQLAIEGPGIGMSGVGYALFGFGWVARDRIPAFDRILNDRTILIFVLWLVGCVVATYLNIIHIGNAAHVSGLLFGAAVAAVFIRRYKLPFTLPGLAALVLAAAVSAVWAPWSVHWTEAQAMRAHDRRDWPAAVRWYRRALAMGAPREWGWHNLGIVYGVTRDRKGYAEAIRHLREVEPSAADELEKDFGPPEE